MEYRIELIAHGVAQYRLQANGQDLVVINKGKDKLWRAEGKEHGWMRSADAAQAWLKGYDAPQEDE